VKVAVCPAVTIWFDGWVVMLGATKTDVKFAVIERSDVTLESEIGFEVVEENPVPVQLTNT
jgi:hypothetical protein